VILPDRKLVTAGAEPLTVAEAKGQLRETAVDPLQDAALARYIKAARIWAENFTARHLIHQVWDLRYPWFPAGQREYLHRADEIRLPRAPLKAWDVSGGTPPNHIKYLDQDGVQQTLVHGTDYVVADGEPAVIFPVDGGSWPGTFSQMNDSGQWPVEIRATFGYGAAGSSVPASFTLAMLLCVAHWYEHREEVSETALEQIPLGAEALLWTERFFPW
jgi:hypothetical protein